MPGVRSVLVAIVLSGALAAGTAAAGGSTGVGGVLYRGPVTPVCRAGIPCDAPAPGVTLVFSRAGRVVRVRTGVGGHFSVALRPGLYAVRVAPALKIGSGLSPRSVRVPVGGWARVRLMLDTGIR